MSEQFPQSTPNPQDEHKRFALPELHKQTKEEERQAVDEQLAEYLERKKTAAKNKKVEHLSPVDSKYSTNLKPKDFEFMRKLRKRVRENQTQGPGFRAWTDQELTLIESFEDSNNEPIFVDNFQVIKVIDKLNNILRKETSFGIIIRDEHLYQMVKLKK